MPPSNLSPLPLRRPVFRIVTPSFNQARFLEQTIRSVVTQEGRGVDFDLRYAVIDGGSNDGSVDIIKRYSDHLTYWCSEKDRGQSHAINKGFEKVDGDPQYHTLCKKAQISLS